MALITTKTITLNGESRIGDIIAESYQATFDSSMPENMGITKWQQDAQVYKANRVRCREDYAEFEELAYALQDELIAALKETRV